MEPPLSSPSSISFLKIPFLFTILAFIIFITTFIYGEDFSCFFSQLGPNSCNPSDQQIPISEIGNNGKSLPFAIGVTKYGCDLFSGKWVRDNSSLPLYKESDCPYIKPQLTCQKNGRPDMDYLYWRWQPHGCIFPRQAGSFNDEKKEIVEVSSEDAYRMGLKSMLGWIKKNMDPKETRVFFTGISPPHNKSIDWGGNPNGNCYNETTIIEDANYWGSDTSKSIMKIIGEEIKSNYDDVPVTFLNITQLSNYRKEAHTSIYKKHWIPPTPEQLANPVSYADCLHWCLPGLQDTWNQLLFTKLFYP